MTEGTDKVRIVREAGQLAGLLDADPLLEQLSGPENAAVNDILHDGKSGGRFEDAAKVVLTDEELTGDLIQCKGLGEVIPDIIQNRSYPQKILVPDGLTGGRSIEHRGNFK